MLIASYQAVSCDIICDLPISSVSSIALLCHVTTCRLSRWHWGRTGAQTGIGLLVQLILCWRVSCCTLCDCRVVYVRLSSVSIGLPVRN